MTRTIVFVGPTLPAAEARERLPGAVIAPPVAFGDVLRLAQARTRPARIAIIDGYFERKIRGLDLSVTQRFATGIGRLTVDANGGIYVWSLSIELSENQARAAGFIVLVLGNLVLALADASGSETRLFDSRHNIFWGVSAVAALVLLGTMTVPFLSDIFRVEAPNGAVIALSVFVAIVAGGWYGVAKRWRRPGLPRP